MHFLKRFLMTIALILFAEQCSGGTLIDKPKRRLTAEHLARENAKTESTNETHSKAFNIISQSLQKYNILGELQKDIYAKELRALGTKIHVLNFRMIFRGTKEAQCYLEAVRVPGRKDEYAFYHGSCTPYGPQRGKQMRFGVTEVPPLITKWPDGTPETLHFIIIKESLLQHGIYGDMIRDIKAEEAKVLGTTLYKLKFKMILNGINKPYQCHLEAIANPNADSYDFYFGTCSGTRVSWGRKYEP